MVFQCFLFGAGIPGTSFYICWVRLMDAKGLEIQNDDEVNWDHLEQGRVQHVQQTERQGYGKGLEKVSVYWYTWQVSEAGPRNQWKLHKTTVACSNFLARTAFCIILICCACGEFC